jgi:beta-phosphoglucomutase-like phosphatase (HAD superfamily)
MRGATVSSRAVKPPAALLDVDGTLVDTNYHHAIGWYRAFRQHGVVLPFGPVTPPGPHADTPCLA